MCLKVVLPSQTNKVRQGRRLANAPFVVILCLCLVQISHGAFCSRTTAQTNEPLSIHSTHKQTNKPHTQTNRHFRSSAFEHKQRPLGLCRREQSTKQTTRKLSMAAILSNDDSCWTHILPLVHLNTRCFFFMLQMYSERQHHDSLILEWIKGFERTIPMLDEGTRVTMGKTRQVVLAFFEFDENHSSLEHQPGHENRRAEQIGDMPCALAHAYFVPSTLF